MLSEDNSSYEDTTVLLFEIAIPRLLRFWIILLFCIPSIICSLFIFYHFIVHPTLRPALHNHVIAVLLFINFIFQLTSILWSLNYYRLGNIWPKNSFFCVTWTFIDEAFYITTAILFAWATIERHILIFHDHLLSTKYKLIFFHYLPVAIILLYCICYSIIIVIFPPCENTYDYNQITCGNPICFYDIPSVAMWDVIVNDIIPTIVIIFCSIALLFRVFYQKYRIHQQIRWRHHRKITIQVLSISVLYLFIYIPNVLLEFIHLCGISEEVGADFTLYAEFFENYGNLLLPFVCTISMPELRKQIKKIVQYCRRQTRVVGPQRLALPRHVVVS
ncbi:unnamed protein product [Rotaria sp. Silwood2]|nr:unnamed protein product [Rotaria sp. Silwood2]CAF2878008.1 unnamed protein product [Rotaria sp. Silwood2]CAF3095526.1 unnamed protein product [Rotaria sp. Silwood2]CAF4445223.1 unnamed protein product [Rotaria sp. Silwood2]CAF4492272.1 unnamed protein product [Rotaria sp. Silwood2]